MFYQILIETTEKIGKSKQNKTINEIDKTDKEEILKDILVPYLNKEEFVFNGYFLKNENIVRLKIVTTNQSARLLAEYETTNSIIYVAPENILGYDKYTTDVTKSLLAEAKKIVVESEYQAHLAAVEYLSIVEPEKEDTKKAKDIRKNEPLDKSKVFIVHGHNSEAKLEVARFIEKMGFEPIILHEQASDGMTIIEKIEKYSNVGFGIVLYTPCDIGYAQGKETEKTARARQNVVFEHGYLISRLGRNNVCALVKQSVETPNDISGIVYIPLDSNGGWKIPLAKEMKSSGYEIDFNSFM